MSASSSGLQNKIPVRITHFENFVKNFLSENATTPVPIRPLARAYFDQAKDVAVASFFYLTQSGRRPDGPSRSLVRPARSLRKSPADKGSGFGIGNL